MEYMTSCMNYDISLMNCSRGFYNVFGLADLLKASMQMSILFQWQL